MTPEKIPPIGDVLNKKTDFELAIEKITGEKVEDIRKMSVEERRRLTEKKFKRKMRFITLFPFIGRGNVLRSHIVSHEEVERELDEALR